MKTFKKTRNALLVAVGALALAGPAAAQSSQAQHGHALFMENGCYLCHGTVGQGGVGPAIAVDLLPYVALSNYVRAPSGQMPPFSEKVVSDADLHDIYAYLSSLPTPPSPDGIKLLPKVPTPVGK
jgi:ubiquinol-cytochrome c reductase cytochrome c subunit